MKIQTCNLIKDLLPLYSEGLVSEDTKRFVEEHLAECASCRAEAERLGEPTETVISAIGSMPTETMRQERTGIFSEKGEKAVTAAAADTDAAPLRKIRKMLRQKRLATVLFTAAVTAAVVVAVFHSLLEQQFIPYSEDVVRITEGENGYLNLTFADEVTGYDVEDTTDPESGVVVYWVSAWNTRWGKWAAKKDSKHRPDTMIRLPLSGDPAAVYYVSCDGSEDVFLYGERPDGGVITLSTGALAFYLFLALALSLLLGVLLFALRRNKAAQKWLWYLFFAPVSYAAGHLLIKGITLKTYTLQNDFIEIAIGAVFIYCAIVLGISRYRIWREIHKQR